MESIIQRISEGKFWHFHGGIHPPEQKHLTSEKPIRNLPLPKQLILPLQQHIGRQGELIVNVGDKVLKGQPLTQSSNPMVVPIHAPTSGIVSAIEKAFIAHPSGLSELCIFIDVDGEDNWRDREICPDFTQLNNQQIIQKIADAGIAGMGGAGFPTHIKVNTKPDINFLIINAAECEPYITADDLLMREHSSAIIDGIKILDQLLNPAFILIGIEDNKPQAIKALQQATESYEKVHVCILPTKYPSGGEKQLIKLLTGQEVTSGTLPINLGIIVQNVATCFAISDAVINDTPLIRRVITLTGQALEKPQNVWALLGTPVSYLLEQAGFTNQTQSEQSNPAQNTNPPVIMGGPMMGFSILNEQVPIVKTSNCILAPSKTEMPSAFDNNSNEVECVRCGLCADVCPSQLLPQELQWSAKAKDHQQLVKLNLFDCIDCGACAYVCPSQIPLVQYYRIAKAEIRQQQQLDLKAEKAKERFEARKLRLEREKIAREEKHKKAAAARKAAMNKKTPEASAAKSAVAAALARVKAKKKVENNNADLPESETEKQASNTESNDKSQVKAAIARAKAKRLAKKENAESPKSETEAPLNEAETDEKAQVKAAIARAKAKRLAKKESAESTKPETESPVSDTEANETKQEQAESEKAKDNADDKKARIAAAVAKAKAKAKAKKADSAQTESSEATASLPSNATTDADKKKARIAEAVAKAKEKAKAKKAQQQQLNLATNEEQETLFQPTNEEAK